MKKNKPHLKENINLMYYTTKYQAIEAMLLNLLDTPVSATHHVGSTAIPNAVTSGVLDVLVLVPNLHAMTTLDEKRLNNAGFYRLHHPYVKKCVFSQFDSLTSLEETVRLIVVEEESEKSRNYMNAHQQMLNSTHLVNRFNQFKLSVVADTKKTYEDEKSNWFSAHIAK